MGLIWRVLNRYQNGSFFILQHATGNYGRVHNRRYNDITEQNELVSIDRK